MLISSIAFAQNFKRLKSSGDSTYGYSINNPLKFGKGDPVEAVGSSKKFLEGLKTADNQDLKVWRRTSVVDPNFKEPPGGLAESLGKGGVLDRYQLVASVTKDTLVLYIDIYQKGKLMIPLGLKYGE